MLSISCAFYTEIWQCLLSFVEAFVSITCSQCTLNHAQALPSNIDRFKKGDRVIRQEINKLLQIDTEHHAARPLLTPDGRVRMKNPSTGQTEVGLPWTEILERAPAYFSLKFGKVRVKETYGKVVHAELTKIYKQLSQPPHLRVVSWPNLDNVIQSQGQLTER